MQKRAPACRKARRSFRTIPIDCNLGRSDCPNDSAEWRTHYAEIRDQTHPVDDTDHADRYGTGISAYQHHACGTRTHHSRNRRIGGTG